MWRSRHGDEQRVPYGWPKQVDFIKLKSSSSMCTHIQSSSQLFFACLEALEAAERNVDRGLHDFKISWQPVGAHMVVSLGERFNKALHNGNTIPAKAMWQKAESMEHRASRIWEGKGQESKVTLPTPFGQALV